MWPLEFYSADAAYRPLLGACGLSSVSDVLGLCTGKVVAWSRTTDVLFVPGPQPAPGFFLKRYRYPTWRTRLRGALRGTMVGPHHARAEYDLLRQMRRLGIPAVRPVACGSRRVGPFVSECFLITEAAPGTRNLTSLAEAVRNRDARVEARQRIRMTRRLAHEIAFLHEAQFSHGQLFWRNILYRVGPDGEPEFFFLDPRPRRGRRRLGRSARWWMVELAQLGASAIPFTSRTDRVRFLVEYFGARRFSADIRRHVAEIERLAARWVRHENQRIRMSGLFEDWNEQHDAESGADRTGTDAPCGGPE